MRKERGLRKEEIALEGTETRDELLIAQKEAKKGTVCMGVRVFDRFIKSVTEEGIIRLALACGEERRTYLSLSIKSSSSSAWPGSLLISILHSRITLRYFPASNILCFHR